MQPYLSVIIPAYNEANRLPLTLTDIDRYLEGVSYTYEVIVVDDGSRDRTADIVEQFASIMPYLSVLRNEKNQGKGAAVRQGMLSATGSVRLFMDADNATALNQFDLLKPYLDEGYDVVIGSRGLDDSVLDPPQGKLRSTVGKLGNLIIQAINLPGIKDTQCGFKAYTAKAAESIFRHTRERGWGFDIEALTFAKAKGYRIKEVAIRWVDRAGSTLRPSAYLKVFGENLRIRWNVIRGTYKAS